jgi:DNA mismatch endonuclease (patch repair protein)
MSSIRSANTKPELALREALRSAGATGYRLHLRSLAGRPDIAYTRWKVAVFVDGAFWHGHPDHFNPERASDYWRSKIAGNKDRDRRADQALVAAGWHVLRCWDFDVKGDVDAVCCRVLDALARAGWRPRPVATP